MSYAQKKAGMMAIHKSAWSP